MMRGKKKVLVIVGPTASGKTAAAIEAAKILNGEIVSADSMQIYDQMMIGTARPDLEEMAGIPHHLVGCVPPDRAFSVADFVTSAQQCIEDIFGRGHQPIVVGGTGLYINGLTLPWDFEANSCEPCIREALEKRLKSEGSLALYQQLQQIDPRSAKNLHPNNAKRVVRALEVYRVSGRPKSFWDEQAQSKPLPYDYVMTGLQWEREILYERINRRVDEMIEQGLLDEVRHLLDLGYSRHLTAMQALGYKEWFPFLDGEQDLEETIRILKRDTRHFAKRQLTWFRRDRRIHWFDPAEFSNIAKLGEKISDYLKEKIKDEG